MPRSLTPRRLRWLSASLGPGLTRRCKLEPLEDRTLLSINITQYHVDAASTGLNSKETSLTPANVAPGSLSKIFDRAVDGQVLAEPLYMAAVQVTAPGTSGAANLVYTAPNATGTHNLVFVATEHDSLYAIDADSGQVIWQDSFLTNYTAGTDSVTVSTLSSGDVSSGDITPEIGITGTPAIDAGTGYLYVVAKTKEIHSSDGTHFVNTLYKVNIHDGTDGKTVIADTGTPSSGGYNYVSGPYVYGSGDGAINVGGQNVVYFNALRQMFRPGVSLVNGQVILGSASHGDNGPYHGWMLTYDENSLALTGVLNTSPNSGLSGIWQGGDSIVSDPQGYFYFETGNGPFDATLNAAGFPINGDYGDSFVKVAVDSTTGATHQNINGWGLKVVDYFTPYNQANLNAGDTDLGSGGPMILPDSVGSTAHPHLLIGGGKQGSIYLIDRDHMGGYDGSTDNVVQEAANTVGGILSTPSYFNGNVYITSSYGGPIYDFGIANGHLTTNASGAVVPISQTPDGYGNLDGSPEVSANGTANGIVWALDRGSGQLRAYDATNLGTELYTSAQVNGDALSSVMKYTTPMVANGNVYVGTGNSLAMFSIPAPPTSPPNAPISLTATTPSSAVVQLNWTDTSNNESAFLLERSTDGVGFTQIDTASVNATHYTDATVQAFTTYFYRVRATNVIGNSGYTNVASATTQGQPAIGGGDGLLGTYYSGTNVNFAQATPLFSRVDSTINRDWVANPDAQLGTTTNFEVRWTGEIQAQYSENYTFSTVSDDGVQLYINGQLVINNFTYHGPTLDNSAPVALQAGKSYSIEMDYFQGGGQAVSQLSWASSHTPGHIIPQSQLFSGTAPAAPTNLQGQPASGTQINLTWTTNATDEDGYEVDRMGGPVTSFTPIAYLPAGSSSYMDTGLAQGTSYIYRVRATNFVANSDWSNSAPITTPKPPATPSNGHFTGVATTAVSMAWTNNATDATAIRIFRRSGLGSNFIFVASVPPSTNSFTDTGPNGKGLTPGTSYDYHIQAGNLAGYTDFTGFTVATLTKAPTQLNAVGASGQVSLYWNAPSGAVTFKIYRGTSPGGENSTPLPSGIITGTTFADTSVSNGTTYYYKVTSVDSGGESAQSAESTATPATPVTVAPPPTGLTATPGDGNVTVAWNASPGASSYNIYRAAAAGAESLVHTAVTATAFTDGGLTNGIAYYYKVTSVNAQGEGIRSGEVSATPQIVVPPAPINVSPTPGDAVVGLTWSPAADALTYNIFRSTDQGDEVLYQQGITGTSFTDNNVTNGVTYYYQVSAGNGVGQSNLSLEVSTTPLPALPAVPTGLTATGISSTQIRLNWTELSSAVASYEIDRSTDGITFAPLTTIDGNVTTYTDTAGLAVGSSYYYRILASNLAGKTTFSTTASAQPLAQLPPPWQDADIGNPGKAGSAYFSNGVITINGSGNDIWNASDQFHFAYQSFSGDGTIIAQVTSQGNTDSWAKAGVMFRNTLDASSGWAMMVLTPGNGAAYQSRDTAGNLAYSTLGGTVPGWVELVRSGSTFTGYYSTDGVNWQSVGSTTVAMNATIYVGLADTSHNAGLVNAVSFANVSINGNGASPGLPAAPAVHATSGTAGTLTWTNTDNTVLADLVYRRNPGSATFSLVSTLPGNANSFGDSGLTPGASYSYYVVSSNTYGNSAPSATVTLTTPLPPKPVSLLVTNSPTTNSVGLSWTLNSSDDTGVAVYHRVNGAGPFNLVTNLPAGTTAYVDQGLQSGTLYEYHVAAFNLGGPAAPADTGATTLAAQPTGLSALPGAGQAQLTWAASTGAVAYNVYRGLSAGGEGATPYATVNNATSFSDTGVTAGPTYYYRITAVNFSGESAPSAEVSALLVVISLTQVDSAGGSSITTAQGTVVPGQALTYTITVSNAGPGTLSNAAVTDIFPASFTGASWTSNSSGGAADNTPTGAGSTLADTVTLPAGSSITYSVQGTVSASATGTLFNSATITAPGGTSTTATDVDNIISITPTVSLANATQSVSENGGTFTVTVNLSAASGVATTVPFTLGGTAASGVNYSGVTASPLVIPAGQTSATITGTLIVDGKYEPTSTTLIVTLGAPTNATLGATTADTVTIVESDAKPTVSLAAGTQSVNENAGTFTVTVNLSAASGVATTVPFTLGGTAAGGANYSGVTASPLVIPAGQTSATITGTLIDDGHYDPTNKTITVNLGAPTNATLGATTADTVTIVESDGVPSVSLAAATQSVNENGGTFTVTVNLSAASGVATTVPFTLGGTAASGVNYGGVTASPLVIPAGQTSATITGTLIDDGHYDPTNKTITVNLGAPVNAALGATSTETISVVETDVPLTAVVAPFSSPRNTAVNSLTINFNKPVSGFGLSSLQLTDNNGPNLLTAAQSLAPNAGNTTWTMSGLTTATSAAGNYTLTLSPSTIIDSGGNTLAGPVTTSWVTDLSAPTSKVGPLAQTQNSLAFAVSVTGSDPGQPASGVSSYDVYVATNGGPFTLWTSLPANNPTAIFTGTSNTRYWFRSLAHDNAGNLETKAAAVIDASTYVSDVTPPTTQIISDTANGAGMFTLVFSGTAAPGSTIRYFNLSVQVDGGSIQPIGQYNAPAAVAGVYSGQTSYQGLADGSQHTYIFSIQGVNGSGVQETAHAAGPVIATFTAPTTAQVTAFNVQRGAAERSYIRYLDVMFNEPVDTAGLTLDAAHITLTHYNLDGTLNAGNGVTNLGTVNLSGMAIHLVDHVMELDFGAGGIGGNENLTSNVNNWAGLISADGYYKLTIDPDGTGRHVVTENFYRLFGDVIGTRGAASTGGTVGSVTAADVTAVANAVGQTGQNLNPDVNGAGAVTSNDRTLTARSVGRRLIDNLRLDN